MNIFRCPKCDIPWADMFLLDGNRCKICGTVCLEINFVRWSDDVFIKKNEQTLEEFLNDANVPDSALERRRHCDREGHKPYPNGGQGMDGMIWGCYCGWITLNRGVGVPVPKNWSDFGL